MIGGGNQLYQEVLDLVEYWIPSKKYDHESKFRKELKQFLETNLNEQRNDLMGMGGGGQYVVKKEHGSSRADIAVDEVVGIEMKRNLTNSRAKRELRGGIDNYLDNYPFVIVVACGLEDTAEWNKLRNQYEGQMGLEGGEVAFVHKKIENYGKDPSSLSGGGDGFLGGGGLF